MPLTLLISTVARYLPWGSNTCISFPVQFTTSCSSRLLLSALEMTISPFSSIYPNASKILIFAIPAAVVIMTSLFCSISNNFGSYDDFST